jgi:SRSO17 transposase
MAYSLDAAASARLSTYFDEIGTLLRDKRKRASFATYAFGILGEGDRKSAEPIAARACGDPSLARAYHERLLHFLGGAKWDDGRVRRVAARHAMSAMAAQTGEPVSVWIIDDTGMLKQGDDSPGVQRQYTGSAGKVANCQIAVTLSVATRTEAVPIDVALYLPEAWANDHARRVKARIPDDVTFKTKPELALAMIERACLDGLAGEVVLADAAYGDSSEFRSVLRLYGLDYAVGIGPQTKVFTLDGDNRPRGETASIGDLAEALKPKAFRRCTWRDGTKNVMSSRFCFVRVKTAHDDGFEPTDREPQWLIVEWSNDGREKKKFHLTTLPRRMTKKQIVGLLKERWRTERVYQELKGELGFDHFEGRTFPGWHHHVSVVLCCYAFVIAERVRHFPPSKAETRDPSQSRAA